MVTSGCLSVFRESRSPTGIVPLKNEPKKKKVKSFQTFYTNVGFFVEDEPDFLSLLKVKAGEPSASLLRHVMLDLPCCVTQWISRSLLLLLLLRCVHSFHFPSTLPPLAQSFPSAHWPVTLPFHLLLCHLCPSTPPTFSVISLPGETRCFDGWRGGGGVADEASE